MAGLGCGESADFADSTALTYGAKYIISKE